MRNLKILKISEESRFWEKKTAQEKPQGRSMCNETEEQRVGQEARWLEQSG
jgi:hypothetical protein